MGPVASVRALSIALLLTACNLPGAAQGEQPLATSGAGIIKLDRGRTDVGLAPVREGRDVAATASLGSALKRFAAGKQVYLTLVQTAAQDAPGVTYNVYLNLPPGAAPQGPSDVHYAGTFGFFDSVGRATDVSLNITPHIERMLARGELDKDTRVTIVPAGQPSASALPQIGRLVVTAR
jgi:tyrosinase